MAYEVRRYSVSIPAGTTAAAPQRTALAMPARIVRRLSVRFPPGPQGQVGVQVGSGGVQVIPWDTGTWLIGDNETLAFDLYGQLESGAWQLIAYNTGAYAHSVYLTFELDPPQLVGRGSGSGSAGPLVVNP